MGIRHRHAAATGVWSQPDHPVHRTRHRRSCGVAWSERHNRQCDRRLRPYARPRHSTGRLRQSRRYHRHRQRHQLASDHRPRTQRQRNGHPELHPQHCITGKARSIERMLGVSTVHRQSRRRRGTYEGRHHRNRATGHRKPCQSAVQAGGEAQRIYPVRH